MSACTATVPVTKSYEKQKGKKSNFLYVYPVDVFVFCWNRGRSIKEFFTQKKIKKLTKLQRGTNILTLDCNNQKLRFRLTRSWSLGLQWPHGYLVPFTDLFLPVLITNLVQVFPRKTDGIRECGSIDRRSAVPCGRDPARASTCQFSGILNWVTFFNRKYVHTGLQPYY